MGHALYLKNLEGAGYGIDFFLIYLRINNNSCAVLGGVWRGWNAGGPVPVPGLQNQTNYLNNYIIQNQFDYLFYLLFIILFIYYYIIN